VPNRTKEVPLPISGDVFTANGSIPVVVTQPLAVFFISQFIALHLGYIGQPRTAQAQSLKQSLAVDFH